ncbi:MAG: discoidin domain-containing protein [Gemmatimonadaceae bacterium]|nr:discoidin domain-containing protein [Gemmatimonadaceae bacterium]
MSIRLISLIVLCCTAAATAQTWEQSSWRSTTYYRSNFVSDAPLEGQLHVAAVDSYEVYFNGVLLGGDSLGTRMQAYAIEVQDGKSGNDIAVKVVNRGGGGGNGLIAAVVTDEYRIETTTNQVVQGWYWTAAEQQGLEWTTADPEDDAAWQTVQQGSVERGPIQDLLDPEIEVVSGFEAGIDVGARQGSLVLSQIRGRNLALDKPGNRKEVVDGKLNTSWDPPTSALNYSASVDLQVRRNVSSVRVVTRGSNPGQLEENSLRGYSVQVSDDQVRWTEVGVIHDIEKFDWTEVRFTPVWTRYVRIVIVDINSVSPPKVAEVEVYGDGYTDEGTYLSEPLSLGAPGRAKNFGRVRWDAEVPVRTDLFVQFRTGNSAEDFEDPGRGWSSPLSSGDVWFPASEPGAWLQYRVSLESRDQRRTPALHSLELDYTTEELAVSGAHSRVTPNRVSMGADTLFVCTLHLAFAPEDAGIERLLIAVPSEARLVDDGRLQGILADWTSTQDALELAFSEPLRDVDQLRIPFRARSHANSHEFRMFLFSPGSDNPVNVAESVGMDESTGELFSWAVVPTTSPDDALSSVRANPSVFTPNGDDINDDTVIELILSKVDTPRDLGVRIFDLRGTLVRDLKPAPLAAGVYLRLVSGARGIVPGYWDGRDDEGRLVPPGNYIYRVQVELDAGTETATGVVGVVY